MKKFKAVFGVALALALVILVGMKLSDHALKATDGEENIIETEVSDEELDAEVENEEGDSEEVADEENASDDVNTESAQAEVVIETETNEESENDDIEIIDNTDKYQGTVNVSSNVDDADELNLGDKITLTADVQGYEGVNYTFQWQSSVDNENWENVSGANSGNYTFTLTEETSQNYWRVILVED